MSRECGLMPIRSRGEMEGLRRIGRVVAETMRTMADALHPGITTGELDGIGAQYLRERGARSAPQLCVGFPAATCISVNEEAAHGIPGKRVVRPGDLINIDVSAELDGFFADTGASYTVEPVSVEARELCLSTQAALQHVLEVMEPGQPINRTGRVVEEEARRAGFVAIRNLYAHGTGRWLHEDPREIANYFVENDHRRFQLGNVIAMETFLSVGSSRVVKAADGWTLRTADGSLAAQYEHTVVITPDGPLVMTLP